MASTDWRAFYNSLDQAASIPLPERLLYKAVILETCSLADEARKAGNPRMFPEVAKDEKQRQAIEFNRNHQITVLCRGFSGDKLRREDIEAAYKSAAAAGSAAAQAWMIALQLAQSAQSNSDQLAPPQARLVASVGGRGGYPDPITPDQQNKLMNALFTTDPVAIRTAGLLLTAGSDRQSFRFGPQQTDLGSNTTELWTLVACQFGLECGPQNFEVSLSCAMRGQCADDYASYLRDFVLSPSEFAALYSHAQSISDAIQRRDYSAFQLVNQRGQHSTIMGPAPQMIRIR